MGSGKLQWRCKTCFRWEVKRQESWGTVCRDGFESVILAIMFIFFYAAHFWLYNLTVSRFYFCTLSLNIRDVFLVHHASILHYLKFHFICPFLQHIFLHMWIHCRLTCHQLWIPWATSAVICYTTSVKIFCLCERSFLQCYYCFSLYVVSIFCNKFRKTRTWGRPWQ